ncbi:hypothetical protein DdX_12138 [Ditylenchus destructor]|uniref:Uncharacterized protein n=1 Tax=Ditylenchus destructor TaxID=166010 RepID=A0AAD4N170_9BILA|nr:hypothetical protein DdX_12138 [Ditylenchus destructor]
MWDYEFSFYVRSMFKDIHRVGMRAIGPHVVYWVFADCQHANPHENGWLPSSELAFIQPHKDQYKSAADSCFVTPPI